MEFIDLKAQYAALKERIDSEVLSVLGDAQFIGGAHVDAFEEELAAYVGRKHCVSCGNGTDALQLAYMALGVTRGDVVFCPDMTFVASVEPAAMLGATPVFVDIDPVSWNISPERLEEAVSAIEREGRLRPRAVVAVDFLGNPADMGAIRAVCDEHGLLLIEDAAQGMGGSCMGSKLGSFGEVATTSFFPSKPLGCYGDGGALFTDDDDIARLCRSLKSHGKGSSKYDNIRVGFNSRLDNVQAAVLRVKLERLDEEMEARQAIATAYDEAFEGAVRHPSVAEGCMSAYAQYVLLLDDSAARDFVKGRLADWGIPTLVYYPKPLHAMGAFGAGGDEGFEASCAYAERNLGLPFSAYLKIADQGRVIETVLDAVEGSRK